MFTHILIGIVFGFIIWKLIKVTFKSIVWILLIALIVGLVFPHLLFLVGGVGFLLLSALGALLLLSIAGLFFFGND